MSDNPSEKYRHHKAKEFANLILDNPDKIDDDTFAALRIVSASMDTTVERFARFILDRYDGMTLQECEQIFGKSDRFIRSSETHFIRIANGEN